MQPSTRVQSKTDAKIVMRTKLTILFFGLTIPFINFSQVTTDNSQTVEWYVQNVLVGTGVTISNVQFNGMPGTTITDQVGEFGNLPSGADVGLVEGMIMGSGDVTMASQPNTGGGNSLGGSGAVATDPDLNSISSVTMYDQAVVEFDFVPDGDSIKFNYVFASEEYDEYVCTDFNDAFGFFLTGPNPAGGSYTAENVALVPDPASWPAVSFTTTPVAINTINIGSPGSAGGMASTCAAIDPAWASYNIYYTQNTGTNYEYDGRTIALPVAVPVICGQTYHIKLAIGDGFDSAFDSGVFLEKGSFTSNAINVSAEIANNDTILYEGCNAAYFAFSRPDTTTDFTVYFDVTGSATNGVDYSTIPDSLEMSAGTYTDTIWIDPFTDALVEPTEDITILITYLNCLGGYDTISATLLLTDFVPLTADMNIPPVDPCAAPDSLLVNLEFTGGGSIDSIAWDMGDGTIFVDDTLVNYYYTSQGNYYIEMYARDVCGNDTVLYDTVNYIANYTTSTAIPPPDQLLCDPPYNVDFDAGTPAPPNAYWDFGDGNSSSTLNPTHTYGDTGTYNVTFVAIDSSTCNITDTAYMTVTIEQAETFDAVIAFDPPPPCGTDTFFVEMAFAGSGADSLIWDMGDGNIFTSDSVNHFYTVPGNYTITMEAYDLTCNRSETITETVSFVGAQVFEVIVPNVFTPNGDQVNDEVKFDDADPDGEFYIIIRNRWGAKVFESTDPANSWKGLNNSGRALEAGIYYYELTYKDQCAAETEQQTKTGYIHLME